MKTLFLLYITVLVPYSQFYQERGYTMCVVLFLLIRCVTTFDFNLVMNYHTHIPHVDKKVSEKTTAIGLKITKLPA